VQSVKDNKGKKIVLEWQNETSQQHHKATLVPRVSPPKNEGSLGISFFPAETVVLSYDTPVQKVFSGITHPADLMAYNFDVLKSLIDVSLKEKNSCSN